MNNFFDNFYGILFKPREAFDNLSTNLALVQSFIIVVIISTLSTVLDYSSNGETNMAFFGMTLLWSALGGIISWLLLALVMEVIAGAFKKGGRKKVLLCLSGFALLPWIFLAPATLLKTGGLFFKTLGIIVGLACWLWSYLLTAYAVVKTYEISPARLVSLIFILPLVGILCPYWFIAFFATLVGIIK